jgi:hypothetical protein
MVERTPERRIIIIRVEQRNADTLIPILLSYVHLESTIHSDLWKAYRNLKLFCEQYKTVNHSLHYKNPLTCVHTNTIMGSWRSIKMSMPLRVHTRQLSLFI